MITFPAVPKPTNLARRPRFVLRFRFTLALATATWTRAAAPDPTLQFALDTAVQTTLSEFEPRGLRPDQLAVTVTHLRDPLRPSTASYRGQEAIYPASVIKLFYLVAAHRWLEDGRLTDAAELRRAMRDMIVDSSNEATHYVIDVLTGTTSGPELGPDELAAWQEKRSAVNRYFASIGYTNINANRKPWNDGPYGREVQAMQRFAPARNLLTTDATARLLASIAAGQCVSVSRSREMLDLMKRDLATNPSDPDDQARFTGPGLPPGARFWSKAGWTSEVRHDAVLVELPNGDRWILVIFTVGHANERDIIPSLARRILEGASAPAVNVRHPTLNIRRAGGVER